MILDRIVLRVLAAIACAAMPMLVCAQAWPDRPIKFLMTAPAGSSIDMVGRTIAEKLSPRLGQPVIVENKPAASGTVAVAEAARAAPDGYTMVLGYPGPVAFAPLIQKLPYDVQKDLAPLIITTNQPNVLVVNAQLPVKTLSELIAYAKANPGKLNYASVGNGSSSHLVMEYLKATGGFDAVHVPFNGSPPAVTATIQNETQMMFAVMAPLQAQIQAGKLRPIAVTTVKRFRAAARPADDRGVGLSRFRCAGLERHTASRRHAEADRRALEHRDQRDLQDAGRDREDACRRLRAGRRHARGFRRAARARKRAMGAGGEEARPQGRLAARPVRRGGGATHGLAATCRPFR